MAKDSKALPVLHIATGLGEGGAEGVLYRLCTSSRERASDIVVSLTSEGFYGERLRAAGIAVHALEMRRSLSWPAACAKLHRIIRSTRPGLVQTWMYHGDLIGGLSARLAGCCKIVWGLRNSTTDPRATPALTRATVRACASLARLIPTRIVTCSHRAAAVHIGLGYPAERIVVVPNGYDLAVFRPDTSARVRLRGELGISRDELVLGLLARFDPQKNIENLLDSLHQLTIEGRRFTLLLAGRGMENVNAELCAAVRARGLAGSVRLLGFRRDVPAIMNALDVHVLSSAYGEAFPNAVAEAMACGTPCVVTDVGDAAQIVGETGWVAPPRDSRALAAGLESALTAREAGTGSWSARQAACRERIVANFSLEKMVDGYESLWRQLSVGDR